MLENCKNGRPVMQGKEEKLKDTAKDRKLKSRLSVMNLDDKVVKAEYAVRGVVSAKAAEMRQRLQSGESLPFKELIPCNIGNPHAVRQKPITFYRHVLACCACPALCEDSASRLGNLKVGSNVQALYQGEWYPA